MWLLSEDRGPVRWLTMNRPERKNAIPLDGWREMGQAFADFETSTQRVLVVTGAGGDFCAGAELDPAAAAMGAVERHENLKDVSDCLLALHRSTKPTVAAVDGVAVGAGMNLALACDFVIATDRVRFSELFVRRGLTVDFGGTWLLPRIVGLQRARELALTGRIVQAEEALRIGLALEIVRPERLQARIGEIVDELLAAAPLGQMFAKQSINRSFELTIEQALAWEGQSQAICLASEDVAEGIGAFLEKRQPHFKGR